MNCISFNHFKSAYIVFKPKKKLLIPHITFNSEILKHSTDVTYLGYRLNAKLSGEDDVLKEIRTLYLRSNILIRTFSKCSEKVKSYCTSLNCSHLWSNYRTYIYSKIRVAYNNVF